MPRDGTQRVGWIGVVETFTVVDFAVDGVKLHAGVSVPVPVETEGMADAAAA